MAPTVGMESSWLVGQVLTALLYFNPKDSASFSSGPWNSDTSPDIAFASADSDSRLPDRRVLKKFPKSQHRPSLITPPSLLCPCQACPLNDGTSVRPSRATPELWQTNSPRLCFHLIHRTWIRSTRTSATSSAQQPKDLSHVVVETTTYRAGIQSVRTYTKCSWDPTKATLAELPELCTLSSTGNGGTDGL